MAEKKNELARDHVGVELGDDMLRDICGANGDPGSGNPVPIGDIPGKY
jgi:hypothetical protein